MRLFHFYEHEICRDKFALLRGQDKKDTMKSFGGLQ